MRKNPVISWQPPALSAALILTIVSISACTAQNRARTAEARRQSARVDSIVQAHMSERQIAGAAVVVMQNDQALKRSGYGYANLETQERATPETAFFVASITKIFTAAAVMALVDDGRLALEDSIGAHVSGLPVTWRKVTVRQLLGFVSGLPEAKTYHPGVYVDSYEGVLDSLRSTPVLAAPGEQYRYTQTNYFLIGKLIEKHARMPFPEFVMRRLLRPQDVRSAAFGDYRAIQPGRAAWYTTLAVSPSGAFADTTRHVLRTIYPEYAWPTAGLHISANDLAHWISRFARGQIVKPASVREIWTTLVLSDGSRAEPLGNWRLGDARPNGWVISTGGARAAVGHMRARGLTIVVLTNTQGAQERRLLNAIAAVYTPEVPR